MEETDQLSFPEELEPSEESSPTREWRLNQFTGLGFETVQAAIMADEPLVDLALARRLVAMGCPLETACRILL